MNAPSIRSHLSPIVRRSNWRVVIEPRRLGDYGYVRTADHVGRTQDEIDRGYHARCEEIAADVWRHVDNVGSAEVAYDEERVCPHCGYTWQPDEWGCNGCCGTEAEAWAVANWTEHADRVRAIMGADWSPPSAEESQS